MAAHPENLQCFWSVFDFFVLNMAAAPRFAGLSEGVPRGALANMHFALAALSSVRASHRPAQPPNPCFIAFPLIRYSLQTYVLAALYVLRDAK